MKRYLIPLGLFLGLAVLLAVGLTLNPNTVPSPLIGKPAPSFELPRLDGQGSFSHTDLAGQVSLVNVWASWCVACRDEHPLFVELARRGVAPIYGLNYKDEEADAKRWLQAFGDPYTVSVVDRDGRVGLDWGVYGVPETFVLDRNGVIRHKVIGAINERIVREELLPLIDKLKAEGAR